ncbi:MAG: hypothetical protein O0X93_09725, partial [Methanocorpusculum sp.]|nr:hypothetical protein [Methanocorpusculum sp.]
VIGEETRAEFLNKLTSGWQGNAISFKLSEEKIRNAKTAEPTANDPAGTLYRKDNKLFLKTDSSWANWGTSNIVQIGTFNSE